MKHHCKYIWTVLSEKKKEKKSSLIHYMQLGFFSSLKNCRE